VVDLDQPVAISVAGGGEPAVPGEPCVEGLGRERLADGAVGVEDGADRERMDGRLADAGGADVARCRGRHRRVPAIRAREVVAAGREPDVRQHPRRPLRAEQGTQFGDRPGYVDPSQADGDEGGVPAPLVRVQRRRRGRHRAEVVRPQDLGRRHSKCVHESPSIAA